jgi:hypothetical protein
MQWFQSPEQHIPPIIESLTQKVVEQHTNQRFATTPQTPRSGNRPRINALWHELLLRLQGSANIRPANAERRRHPKTAPTRPASRETLGSPMDAMM